VVQRAGECVVVTPNTAHFGFNLGPNIAEAANFPTPDWIPYGMVAPKCTCMGYVFQESESSWLVLFDSLIKFFILFRSEVHLDMERIIAAIRPEWLKAYRRNEIPAVSKEEDPDLYMSILRINTTYLESFTKDEIVPEVNLH